VAELGRFVDQQRAHAFIAHHFASGGVDRPQLEQGFGVAARRCLAVKRVGPDEIPFDVLPALVHPREHHQRRHLAALRGGFEGSDVHGRLGRGVRADGGQAREQGPP
jgi:hypothetical protein